VKRTKIGTASYYFLGNAQAPTGTNGVYFGFAGDQLLFGDYGASAWDWYVLSSSLYRDTAAWYHVVAQYDTTQATASERIKLYVNGVRLTAFDGASTYPTLNVDGRFNQASVEMAIGRLGTYPGNYFDGYMAEVNFIDGQALTPSSFGETDATTGRWKAKAFVGTYGTNGFYLPFSDNSSTPRSNLIRGSEDLGNTALWTMGECSITPNTTAAPNGSLTADTFTDTATTNQHLIAQSIGTLTIGSLYTVSIYAKANTRTQIALTLHAENYASFDLSNGTIISNGGYSNCGIQSVGNGWYRCYVTINKTNTIGNAYYLIYKDATNVYLGTGTGSIYIWGAQVELASSLGPYYPTTASASTSTLLLGKDMSATNGGYNSWVSNNLSVTEGTGNDSLTDSPSNYGAISTTLADDAYQISKSLRFNSADSAYLNRTPASAGNRKTWTWSGWVKRGTLGGNNVFMGNVDSSGYNGLYFQFDTSNNITIGDYGVGSYVWVLTTSQVFRDTSAWYHIVASFDSTQSTASDRVSIYINGAKITSFSTATYPSLNLDGRINSTQLTAIGRLGSYNGFYFDGYMAEINFIDGQALTPSSFGTRDINTYLWKPKAYSGTYGTNGFYLPFTDNSEATATTLGKDSAPISGTHTTANNWTPNNLSVTEGTGNDNLIDSPTYYGTLSATPSVDAYQIGRSLRFKGASGGALKRTPATSAGNPGRRTWNWSGWVKRSTLGTVQQLFNRSDALTPNVDYTYLYFRDDNTIQYLDSQPGSYAGTSYGTNYLTSKAAFTDTSNWYHILMCVDTTQAIDTNRLKLYVNGVQITSFISQSYPALNSLTQINTANTHCIGSNKASSQFFEGYLADINLINLTAVGPDSFGFREVGTYLWKPKAFTGAYGTWGFNLRFEDNSTIDALGTDSSGNLGNWGVFSGTGTDRFSITAGVTNDSLVDSPTYYGTDNGAGGEARGSYCTLNPNSTTTGTFSNGNLRFVGPSNPWARANGTINVSSGKWYYEVTLANAPYSPRSLSSGWNGFGFGLSSVSNSSNGANGATDALLLTDSGYLNNFAGSGVDVGALASGDVLSVAVDLDANSFTFRRNNTSVSSGTIGGTPGRSLVPCIVSYDGVYGAMDVNFGQRVFRYAAPTGFKALRDYNKPPVPTGGELRGNYATLNPLSHYLTTFTNGNLDFSASGVYGQSMANFEVSSGKWYFELTVGTPGFIAGIIQKGQTIPVQWGVMKGWYSANGNFYDGATNTGSPAVTYTTGDVIGFALDLSEGTLKGYKNGTLIGTIATGLTGTWYPAFSGHDGGPGARTGSWNFGQRQYVYPPPFGFKPLRDYNKLPTPTGGEVRGNYATLNPLDAVAVTSTTNGNLDVSLSASGSANIRSTIAVSSGKWYWEVLFGSTGDTLIVGACDATVSNASSLWSTANAWMYYSLNGQKYNGSGTSYGATFTNGDLIGIALDMDNGTISFYKNGVSQGQAYSGLIGKTLTPTIQSTARALTATANFGQRPWAYDAPFGFKPLCTTLLPQPIVQKPSTAMDVVTYTGTATGNTISGFGFSPDLVWIKSRSGNTNHNIFDTIRGATAGLVSNSTASEYSDVGTLAVFNTNGFTLGGDGSLRGANQNLNTYVAWAWDAGSSSVTNTSGSITSTVRANPQAGFSIVTATTPSSYTSYSVGHGLGVTPAMIIYRERSGTVNWWVWHKSFSGASNGLILNTTNAIQVGAYFGTHTSTVASFPAGIQTGFSTGFVAYCFAEIEGYSKFGSYTGNGVVDGPFVYCGFRPRYILIKRTDVGDAWIVKDTARSSYNGYDVELYPNYPVTGVSGVEGGPYSPPIMDYLSNGFKLRSNTSGSNATSGNYIFAAFAESPFKYSRAR
jgi:hypothetical protein